MLLDAMGTYRSRLSLKDISLLAEQLAAVADEADVRNKETD